jgi:serine phosphatase RsbU (regulator of sigma subunit)
LETPADILTELHARIVRILSDNAPDQQLEDGLDIALCRINRISLVIEYAGANLPLIFWNGKDLLEFRSNRQAIGKNYVTNQVSDEAFSNQELYAKAGDAIFLMTDGMADQFGEGWSKKLTKKKLLDFIREQCNKDLKTLPARTELFLSDFRGSTPQTDDYLLIGVRF